MAVPSAGNRRRAARRIAWGVTILLAVRFSASTALVGVNLSPPTLVTVGGVLEAYEILLPFVLLPVFYLELGWRTPPVPFRPSLAVLLLLGAGLVSWLLAVLGVRTPFTADLFLILAVASVATCATVAYRFFGRVETGLRAWTQWTYRAVLAALPVVFAMRIAALEGLDPASTSFGIVRGNWLFVNVPTIVLEFLVVAVFINVVLDRKGVELRGKWYAFLPFLLVPLIADAIVDRPLTGYVLSALISWGANLALFSPAVYSLGLVTAVFACFASSLLLLGRRGNEEAWDFLFLGCASAVFAGFYPSMASVAGLGVAMLLMSVSTTAWKPRPAEPVRG